MGLALWRRAEPALSAPAASYRIEVFGAPRSPWRSSPAEAMADAIALDLASWDDTSREFYLAVPVDMRVRHYVG